MPIENFSTDYILGLNLKESLDTIQKIGESAAKEYQIEQGEWCCTCYLWKQLCRWLICLLNPYVVALDKMEREWEHMNLNIHPYRETGTGVIKGELPTYTHTYYILFAWKLQFKFTYHTYRGGWLERSAGRADHHDPGKQHQNIHNFCITYIHYSIRQLTPFSTQTIMFSAFKGPFEARIEEWNRKLCCVSDVLEVITHGSVDIHGKWVLTHIHTCRCGWQCSVTGFICSPSSNLRISTGSFRLKVKQQ